MGRWGMTWGALVACTLGACLPMSYACEADTQCGESGRCEADGWCSFPDDACRSGRRYAKYSGGGLGDTCVAPPPEPVGTSTSTSGGTPQPNPGSSGGGDVTTSDASSTTTAPGFSESSSDGGEHDGSSSTSGGPVPCAFVHDFDDDEVIDTFWDEYVVSNGAAHSVVEQGEALRWVLAPSVGFGQLGLQHQLDFSLGRVRVRMSSSPTEPDAELVLGVNDVDSKGKAHRDYFVVWYQGLLDIRGPGEDNLVIDSVNWVQLERLPNGEVQVSTSSDGRAYDVVQHFSAGLDQDDVWVRLYGQTLSDNTSIVDAQASVDFIEICEP